MVWMSLDCIQRREHFIWIIIMIILFPVGAVAYFFVWNPPTGLSGLNLFGWLLGFTVIVRLMYTFFEVPSTALAATPTDSLRSEVKEILNFLTRSLAKDILIKANSLTLKSDNVSKVISMLLQNKV